MANMLRGKNTVAGLTLLEVRRAITQAARSRKTEETRPDRAPRQYKLGPVLAEMCMRLLLWEGHEQSKDGVHKSFSEMSDETGYSVHQIKGARKLGEEEGLLKATPGFRPGRERQRTLYWRIDYWRLHEVVFESALEETRYKLEREGSRSKRDKLNKRRRVLERALYDLRLEFLDVAEPLQEHEGGDRTTHPEGDSRLGGLQEETQEVTSVDHRSTPVGDDAEAGQIMQNIYEHMKKAGFRLDNKEYTFNLSRVQGVLDNDNPSANDLSSLPEACKGYFTIYGHLDAKKALRRSRQQAARSEIMAQKPHVGWGRRSPFTQHDQPEDDWE